MFDYTSLGGIFTDISGLMYHIVLIALIALIDFVTITRARFVKYTHRVNAQKNQQIDVGATLDYSVLIPIFGNLRYLKNVNFLAPYGNRVILCTTTKETGKFNNEIEAISKKHGFRIYRSEVKLASASHKPNPWKLFNQTLVPNVKKCSDAIEKSMNQEILRDEIMRDSFVVVKSKYCIFLDGDTVSEKPLDCLMQTFINRNLDISSVRVLASKTDTMIEKLQAIEYELAMDVREVYPWLTSGACMIAKTEVIQDIMSSHSLFFQGGDIEIGKLADMKGYHVGHIPYVLYTDVPETFKVWFRQRVAWAGGGFRHAVINFHVHSWRYPMFFFYMTILVYMMTPLRWYEFITHPIILLFVVCLYWLLIFIFQWKTFKPFFFLFPFYALLQVMVIIPLGIAKYFFMAYSARNAGMIKNKFEVIKLQPVYEKYST